MSISTFIKNTFFMPCPLLPLCIKQTFPSLCFANLFPFAWELEVFSLFWNKGPPMLLQPRSSWWLHHKFSRYTRRLLKHSPGSHNPITNSNSCVRNCLGQHLTDNQSWWPQLPSEVTRPQASDKYLSLARVVFRNTSRKIYLKTSVAHSEAKLGM